MNSISGFEPFRSPNLSVMYSWDAIFGSSLPGSKEGRAGAIGKVVWLPEPVEDSGFSTAGLLVATEDFVSCSFDGIYPLVAAEISSGSFDPQPKIEKL